MNDFRLYKSVDCSFYLSHFGVGADDNPPGRGSGRYPKGSGKRPNQHEGGKYTAETVSKEYRKKFNPRSKYNKRHFDKSIDSGTEFSTMSWNPDRLKDVDMYYAHYKPEDVYNFSGKGFNTIRKEKVYDDHGNEIGTGKFGKWQLKTVAITDMKVASEDSGADAFIDLYKKNKDFYKFITDDNRFTKAIAPNYKSHKAYRKAMETLNKLKSNNYMPSEEEVREVYKLFNFVLPSDGHGNEKLGKDIYRQRAKFFNALSKKGYDALLDTNDSLYGGARTDSSVIIFNMNAIIPSEAKRTTMKDIRRNERKWRLESTKQKIKGLFGQE